MIICNSKNFAVTRAPKTGGTSLVLYMLESGLVDTEKDTYELEGGFATWQEFKEYSDAHNNLDYSEIPENLWGQHSLGESQITFDELVSQGRVSPDMPCIGSVRNPLDWLASLYYYANLRRKLTATTNLRKHGSYTERDLQMAIKIKEPNSSFDFVFDEMWEQGTVKQSLRAQTDYYPDHAKLFNIENIHEHATDFITSKGGAVIDRIEMRKSDHDSEYYVQSLTADRKQRALDMYEKDLVLWENAYAVYN